MNWGLSGDVLAMLEAAGFMAVIFAVLCPVLGAVERFSLPNEEKFGLKLVRRTSRRGRLESYEGEMDGVRVRLDHRDDWAVSLAANCGSSVRLFAHRPMAAFDRPLLFILGWMRRLKTPAAYGAGWTFYGSPASSASLLLSRLPRPKASLLWKELKLGGGSLEVGLECRSMSLEGLRRQVAAFRELLSVVC